MDPLQVKDVSKRFPVGTLKEYMLPVVESLGIQLDQPPLLQNHYKGSLLVNIHALSNIVQRNQSTTIS